jgi:hypothetical protein
MPQGGDPRIVRVGTFEYRYFKGRLQCRVPGRGWIDDPHRPEDYAALADLVNHPTEDESERPWWAA